MKFAIGADHAAFEMKKTVKEFLLEKKIDVIDCGTFNPDRVDYPDYAIKVSKEVVSKKIEGILLCGSGIGVSIVANRFQGIRAALCHSPLDSELAKKHNDANVLCLGARTHSKDEILKIIEAWLENSFEGGRHAERLKIFEKRGEVL